MENFIDGVVLGLSSGGFCLVGCVPFLLPYFLSEERKLGKSAFIILEFLGGRLAAYLLFGLIFGIVGEYAKEVVSARFVGVLMIVTSAMLFIYGFTKNFPEFKFCKIASKSAILKRFPFASGFLLGINICPPFLVGMTVLVSLGNIFFALIFSLGFFLATTLFLLPLVFSPLLAKISKLQEIGQVITLFAGLYFFIQGVMFIL